MNWSTTFLAFQLSLCLCIPGCRKNPPRYPRDIRLRRICRWICCALNDYMVAMYFVAIFLGGWLLLKHPKTTRPLWFRVDSGGWLNSSKNFPDRKNDIPKNIPMLTQMAGSPPNDYPRVTTIPFLKLRSDAGRPPKFLRSTIGNGPLAIHPAEFPQQFGVRIPRRLFFGGGGSPQRKTHLLTKSLLLVGAFNPFEKY